MQLIYYLEVGKIRNIHILAKFTDIVVDNEVTTLLSISVS